MDANLYARIQEWIAISENDLKSSRILYLANQHHTSYFLFQQSVEKAVKALALFAGFTDKELKEKIGHNPLKVFAKNIGDSKREISELIENLEKFPGLKNHKLMKPFDFNEYHRFLDGAIIALNDLKNEDFVFLGIEDIDSLLDSVEEAEYAEVELPQFDSQEFAERLSDLADFFTQAPSKPGEMTAPEFASLISTHEGRRQMYQIIRYGIKKNLTAAYFGAAFVACAFFTVQHSTKTRYIDGDTSPLKIYTKRLPLVRKQGEIMDTFERAVRTFKRFLGAEFALSNASKKQPL